MPRMNITMTEAELKEAVAKWLSEDGRYGTNWTVQDVTVGTEEAWEGYGTSERLVHRVNVTAERVVA